eukprot:14587536-Alexandrium_andersonii.AAC.1
MTSSAWSAAARMAARIAARSWGGGATALAVWQNNAERSLGCLPPLGAGARPRNHPVAAEITSGP